MKSQKSVGRAFTDVWEAFSEYFSLRNADFQLAGLLPTFGERLFATKGAKNLVRQAPSAPGAQRGVPLRLAQEPYHTMHPGRRAAMEGHGRPGVPEPRRKRPPLRRILMFLLIIITIIIITRVVIIIIIFVIVIVVIIPINTITITIIIPIDIIIINGVN